MDLKGHYVYSIRQNKTNLFDFFIENEQTWKNRMKLPKKKWQSSVITHSRLGESPNHLFCLVLVRYVIRLQTDFDWQPPGKQQLFSKVPENQTWEGKVQQTNPSEDRRRWPFSLTFGTHCTAKSSPSQLFRRNKLSKWLTESERLRRKFDGVSQKRRGCWNEWSAGSGSP